jgi:hypothetical protein
VLILRFGVLQAVNPPSETLRGLFVLSCAVAGIVGGGVAIFFWKGTKYFIGAWGGFAFGLFIQALHDGGLIKPLGFRWALYTGAPSNHASHCYLNTEQVAPLSVLPFVPYRSFIIRPSWPPLPWSGPRLSYLA